MLVLDCEVYTDYFLIMFKNIESGRYASYEMFDGQELHRSRVIQLMKEHTTVSFNGLGYDIHIITAALEGWPCDAIKRLSDEIIKSNLPAWQVAKNNRLRVSHDWDHIDVIDVAPGKAGLKIYGGRMGAPKLQDLPIAPDASITPEQRVELRRYCKNDLDTTEALYRQLEPAIKLREQIGAQYGGIDLRSKSDAQIAEAVIKYRLHEYTGRTYKPRKVAVGHECRYEDPKIVSFQSEELQKVFHRILKTGFPVGTNGAVTMPEWLQKQRIKIGSTDYQMGIGGLHSCEKKQTVVAQDNQILADFDVTGYYPSIILKLKLAPKNMGSDFLLIYQDIVTERVVAKRRAQELEKQIKVLENDLKNL